MKRTKVDGREAARLAVANALWWFDFPTDLTDEEEVRWIQGFAEERDRILARASEGLRRAYRRVQGET